MTIQELEHAVTQLSPKDLASFRQWFENFDAQNWDHQFESDVKSGKLNKIAEKALADYKAGKAKEL
jgi:major membrane immunogen (membrane-anchored lipoprotein)